MRKLFFALLSTLLLAACDMRDTTMKNRDIAKELPYVWSDGQLVEGFTAVRRLGSIGGKAGLAAYFFILKIKTMNNQFDPLSDFKSDETVLNLVKEVFEFSVNPHEFASMAFDVRQAFGQYMVRIQREMFGDKVKKDVMVIFTFKHPKTWWQHFKQDNFPAWLLRRFPVQYAIHTENKTVEFDRTFVFPNAYREGHSVLGKFIIRDYHRIQ